MIGKKILRQIKEKENPKAMAVAEIKQWDNMRGWVNKCAKRLAGSDILLYSRAEQMT